MRARPVVALDIDGTLIAESAELPAGWVDHGEVIIPAGAVSGAVHSPFAPGGGQDDIPVRVVTDPKHAAWIHRLLIGGAEVVFASLWCSAANTVFRPLLDPTLPNLPLGVDIAVDRLETPGPDAVQWKWTHLRRRYAGRPLCWIDDAASGIAEALDLADERRWHSGAPCLVVAPDPHVGLTSMEMDRVGDWLRSVSGRS